MLQLLILLQARLVWSFFTKSTQCLKPWQQYDMISPVKLSISEKFNKLHCSYTDTKPFILLKAFVPIFNILHVHITCTVHHV